MGQAFKVIGKDGEVLLKQSTFGACYSAITYQPLNKKTDHILLYDPVSNVPYKQHEVELWIKTIRRWGFPMTYLGVIDNCHHIKIPIVKGKKQIYINRLHLVSAMTLVRYMFEHRLNQLPKHFFAICKAVGKNVNKFAAMQVAHLYIRGNSNHSLRYMDPHTLVKKRDIFKEIKKDLSIYTQTRAYVNNTWSGQILPDVKPPIGKDYKKQYTAYMKNKFPQTQVFVVGGRTEYANWLPKIEITKNLEQADVVLFTGGEDVHPSLYNEPVGQQTYSNLERDMYEKEIFLKAQAMDKKFLGVCRGSQFLCVMAGGKLVQHQDNPKAVHEILIDDYGYTKINITSTHHQAQYPYNLHKFAYTILGYTQNISPFHLDGNEKELNPQKECEIVYYRNIKALAIQGHPEFPSYQADPNNAASLKHLKGLFTKLINNQL